MQYSFRNLFQKQYVITGEILERAKGIEPSYRAWEALVLPLNYARVEVRGPL